MTRTNVAYTEVGANLCVQDANGNWSDSDGSLAIVADGAASGNSPLAVHFAGDANAAGGTVTLTSPDGKVFVSKVYGITFYDPSIGTNVLLAPLQSSQGKLVGNNHIWYPNAFAGLNADLWYTLFHFRSGPGRGVARGAALSGGLRPESAICHDYRFGRSGLIHRNRARLKGKTGRLPTTRILISEIW